MSDCDKERKGEGEQERKRRLVLIGLGANLGDCKANLHKALDLLEQQLSATQHGNILRVSSLYETEPVGVTEIQPSYLNAVIEVETDLPLTDLLDLLETIEVELGRTVKGLCQPRQIDLDILWAEGESICSDRLTVPHPRLWERAFVLVPLSELVSELDGISVYERASQLAKLQKVKLVSKDWMRDV